MSNLIPQQSASGIVWCTQEYILEQRKQGQEVVEYQRKRFEEWLKSFKEPEIQYIELSPDQEFYLTESKYYINNMYGFETKKDAYYHIWFYGKENYTIKYYKRKEEK
jgi:hypothetical protein